VFCNKRFIVEFTIVRGLCGIAILAGMLGTFASVALSQDKAPSTLSDEIFARKILMDTIDRHMDAIDWMVTSNKPFDLAEAVEHADTISAMLMSFRHLFPPETNQWRPDTKHNPARDTFASPALWAHFADFYRQAGEASRVALNASRAKGKAEFKRQFEALRTACDSCHAAYVKADE
jgi:cytochrome c556